MLDDSEGVVFLANPTARSGKGGLVQRLILAEIANFLYTARSGTNSDSRLEVKETHSPQELRAAAAQAAQQGQRVVVAGGDGTIHQAINSVAGTDAVLGIVAAGTGNDLARALGLPVLAPGMRPAKLVEAIKAAVAAALGEAGRIDAIAATHLAAETDPRSTDPSQGNSGQTNSGPGVEWNVGIVTCGFAFDVDQRAAQLRWPRGPSKYTIASVLQARELPVRHYLLNIDGEQHEIEAVLLAFANTSSFGGGYHIAPEASCTDGLLDLVVVGAVSPTTLLRLMPATRSGRHMSHPAATLVRGQVMEIRLSEQDGAGSKHPHLSKGLLGDGELLGELPQRLELVPNALRIAGAG